MSSLAPNLMNVFFMNSILSSLIFVVNLPSLKVPAPPSPYWRLLLILRIPLLNKSLRDTSPANRFLALTTLQLGYAAGNNETIQILKELDKLGFTTVDRCCVDVDNCIEMMKPELQSLAERQ